MSKCILKFFFFAVLVPTFLLGNDFEAGVIEYKKGQYPEALFLFNSSCNKGNKQGCYNLAVMYKHGQGIRPSRQKAQKLFSKACQIKISECRFNNLNNES